MVRTVLDVINIQVRAITIYRVGKCGPKPRFLLAELPTRAHAVEVLRNGRLLKDSACQHIFVGLSMTPQERTDWFRKRQQLKAPPLHYRHLSQKLQCRLRTSLQQKKLIRQHPAQLRSERRRSHGSATCRRSSFSRA
ncbi:hypothetical protein AAVH_25684, partial [Aphelenchoides avenae]